MAKPKSLPNMKVQLSMTVKEWEILFNAAFEYAYEVSESTVYDVNLLERTREKAESKLQIALNRPRYLYRNK